MLILGNVLKLFPLEFVKDKKGSVIYLRSAAASLMATVKVLSENYIDNATPEEILANALRLSTVITRAKSKSDAEYLAEAREWIGADLGKPSDGG